MHEAMFKTIMALMGLAVTAALVAGLLAVAVSLLSDLILKQLKLAAEFKSYLWNKQAFREYMKEREAEKGVRLDFRSRYELYSGDVIEVIDIALSNTQAAANKGFSSTTSPVDKSEELCKCRLIELHRDPGTHAWLSTKMINADWPGKSEGDVLEYLRADGRLCGWDNRSCPLHVKRYLPKLRTREQLPTSTVPDSPEPSTPCPPPTDMTETGRRLN